MMFGLLGKFAACLAALCVSTQVAAAGGPSLDRQVQNYLQPLLDTNNFSGVVASLSKPFTAAAILLLAERGKIDLKAPLKAVLPDYPQGEKLTIHHLLTHTSGIPNINDFPEYEDVQRKPHTPSQLVALFSGKPLEFEPGTRYSYSNSNYNLLAKIIETVSGTDYGSFLRSAILEPLKLKQTGHHGSAGQIIKGIANGYAPSGSVGLERAPYLDWSVKTGNGSLYSDAEGVMRFIRAVHQGHLLEPASAAAAFTAHTPNVGYGWFLTEANRREIHHINGRSPGWAAQADYYVKDDTTVVVLSNSYISVTTEIARAVGAIYFGEPVKPMPALRPDPLSSEQAAVLVGQYQFGPDYYVPDALISIRSNKGHLEAMVGDYGPYPLVQISPTRFLIRSFWVPAEFTLGNDGGATGLAIDGRKGVRIR
jgi:CubicO group peptidase (beta-lactamase class C family)